MREKMLKENNFTNKGIYFALRYFYEIKHGDKEKSHGGIGIVPYIYGESAQYWIDREKKNKGTIENIIKQMKIFDSPEITVKVNKPKLKNKRKYLLHDITNKLVKNNDMRTAAMPAGKILYP